jgi:hypothetical protein
MMSWKGFARKLSWPRYYPGIRLEGLRKTKKPHNQSPGLDTNPGASEYEADSTTAFGVVYIKQTFWQPQTKDNVQPNIGFINQQLLYRSLGTH